MSAARSFDALVAEAEAAPVDGWDFSWLDGRAIEEPPRGATLGVVVVAHEDPAPLPFAAAAFDLVTSRHPVTVRWDEIARVLRPGGAYLAQHVGPHSAAALTEHFLGAPEPGRRSPRDPGAEREAAEAAGLDVVDLRTARLRSSATWAPSCGSCAR